MKIAILGYGKMGKLIERIAINDGHIIVAKYSKSLGTVLEAPEELQNADICIDVSHSCCILDHVLACAKMQKNIVIGTTNWEREKDLVHDIVQKYQIGCFYSPNFSIGFNLFKCIIAHAAQLMNAFDHYDVFGLEHHHRQKVDSPSGTARTLVDTLISHLDRKTQAQYDRLNREIQPQEIHYASVRSGSNPGTHTICFDSPIDSITLTHQSHNREGFARGAIQIAQWMQDKKGFLTMEDFLNLIY